MPSRLASRLAAVTALAVPLITAGCGKSKQEPTTKKEASAPAAAPKKAEKPKPPDLGVDIAKFSDARVIQLCAARFGESEEDALTLAIDRMAGRDHQAAAKKKDKPAEESGKPGAQQKAGKAGSSDKKGAPKTVTAKPDLAEADGEGGPRTPAGRVAIAPEAKELVDKYQRAVSLLPKRADVEGPIKKRAESCRWSPRLGLVSQSLVDRYVEAFVEVSCLQITMRDAKGQLDALKHAQAATEVFKKHGFDAKRFSEVGVAMAAFGDVTAKVHQTRRDRCADPVEQRRNAAEKGEFVGSFRGALAGTLSFTADDGAANGTAVHLKGKLKGRPPWELKGAVSSSRVHLFGRDGSDWLRLEGAPSDGISKGKWQGEVAAKKLSGTWQWRRKPAPRDAADPRSPATP